MINNQLPPRWQNYVLSRNLELMKLWNLHLKDYERKVLFVLGKGFDSRMCLGIETLMSLDNLKKVSVQTLNFEEGDFSPSRNYADKVLANWKKLLALIDGKADLSEHVIKMWSDDRRRIGSRSAAFVFQNFKAIEEFTDIIIDISAMPRSIYIPLIGSLLHLLDASIKHGSKPRINLHIWVSENSFLDANINDEEVEEVANFIHGYGGNFDLEATVSKPSIWIPVLGEGQQTQLERIYDRVKPDEICPVLPSPALNPRRGDNIILEYRSLLFDNIRVEPKNFIYAAEQNPFEVYRQIRRTILHYQNALDPLGSCKTVISALSSKLMSLGALLVAYELKDCNVGIAHIESNGYRISEELDEQKILNKNELFGLWLYGECYEN